MNTPRFFSPQPLSAGACVDLSESAARHAARVLRMREGDSLTLFDGAGGESAARIVRVGRDTVAVEVMEWNDVECESPIDITLVQALQSGEKMDLTVQKAVELGVRRIVPVTSRRSVVRLEGERAERRVAHWRAVAASACEQCGRNRVPEVSELQSLRQWLAQPACGETVIRLLLDPRSTNTLDRLPCPTADTRIELLIGAEGGLSPEEMDQAFQAGFAGVRLGPRVLRTETAGLAALAAIQCLWGDFRGEAGHV